MQSLQWHFPAPQALAEPGELLQEGAGRSPGDGMLGGQRWQPAALPRGRLERRNKGTFSTFFLSFISQAEADSIRCKTKCQEKDVCCAERRCCRKAACLSLAAFCFASSTDEVIQRFCSESGKSQGLAGEE